MLHQDYLKCLFHTLQDSAYMCDFTTSNIPLFCLCLCLTFTPCLRYIYIHSDNMIFLNQTYKKGISCSSLTELKIAVLLTHRVAKYVLVGLLMKPMSAEILIISCTCQITQLHIDYYCIFVGY